MFTRISSLSVLFLCCVLVGCGGTTIEVSVEGQGTVTSNPEGIECGSGLTACKKTFSSSIESITLTALAPSDGSYKFSKWGGACNDSNVNCLLTKKADVKAVFLSTDALGNLPTKPNGMQVSAMSTTHFFLRWGASSDQNTPEPELQYRIYLSDKPEGIITQSNLVATLQGAGTENYNYDLNVEEFGIVSTTGEYAIAITALDTDGFESEALIASNQKLQSEDLELMAGINLIESNEAGFPDPTITEDEVNIYYSFEGVEVASLPSINDIVAHPASDDGVQYHELLRVIEVGVNSFRSIVIPPSEIMTKPIKVSGSAIGGESKDVESEPSAQKTILNSANVEVGMQAVECTAEDITKLSIVAQNGFKEPRIDYDITLLKNPLCLNDPNPSACFIDDDHVSVTFEAEPMLIANFNMQGGECYQFEAEKPIYDKDLFQVKLFKKIKIKAGKLRTNLKLAYSLNGSSSAAVIMSNKLEVQDLGFVVTIRPDGPDVISKSPSVVFTSNNTLDGSINYTILIEPRIDVQFDLGKVTGFEYEGKLASILNGTVSAKSLSELSPADVYIDTYNLDLKTQYTHTFTPIAYIVGWDQIQDEVAYESDTLMVFSLPYAANEPIAESFQNNEMCRITYQFTDGINNPLVESPFNHYLLFSDSAEIPFAAPVSVTKTDNVTSFVYEFSQKELFEKYVSIAKEKAYKRIARGRSRIGDTVVDNTDFKNL